MVSMRIAVCAARSLRKSSRGFVLVLCAVGCASSARTNIQHPIGKDTVQTFGPTRRFQIGRAPSGMYLTDRNELSFMSSRVQCVREVDDFVYVIDEEGSVFVIDVVHDSVVSYTKLDAIPALHLEIVRKMSAE